MLGTGFVGRILVLDDMKFELRVSSLWCVVGFVLASEDDEKQGR